MPTWYFVTLEISLVVVGLSIFMYSSYLEYRGVRPQLVMNWDAPEGAAVLLLLLCWFGLMPPERWIAGLSFTIPVFWCLRAMYRGHKANALLPHSKNTTKDTSWN